MGIGREIGERDNSIYYSISLRAWATPPETTLKQRERENPIMNGLTYHERAFDPLLEVIFCAFCYILLSFF